MAKASSALVAAIKTANKNLSAAWATGDMKAVAGCYTKDAKLLPANAPAQNGQSAIARFWDGAYDMGIKGVALRTIEIESHGNTAIEYGIYTLKSADGKKLDVGKYIVVWKQQRGKWKLHRDILNSNNAA